MLSPEIKSKLAKVYELVKRGTDGEKAAAEKMLDKILSKHGLNKADVDFESLSIDRYSYTYTSNNEIVLAARLVKILLNKPELVDDMRLRKGKKLLIIPFTKMDSITFSCAYEYFRRHMKAQWNKTCIPELRKYKNPTVRSKRRSELQEKFISYYLYKSKLFKEGEVKHVDKVDDKELMDLLLLRGLEGGTYSTQLNTGLLLDTSK